MSFRTNQHYMPHKSGILWAGTTAAVAASLMDNHHVVMALCAHSIVFVPFGQIKIAC